ncbi:conserved oligomeric Golgi complex subunit 8-like [Haliotis rufescens]|uniref:conserved oligomeric Golgi complex subunit 8-like n=1 Tax=Haliotis rufescens TaxID=6454 RepID=UPI00201F8E28|nr:conserved oligomeric Golgi complex subunit 8-like [Haliotis rufescens]
MATLDVEDENILTSIFKDAFPDSWQDNPDFVQYLVELSSCGVERLSREPDRLAEEKSQILSETQDLAFHNYTTFIHTADCSKEIFQDFQIIEKHVDNLLTKLPPFSDECQNVVKKAQEISSSRRMNTLTLQRHTQLLEVLEMPQLMDTCVRNGYYEEALELAAHVRRLEKKHAAIPVIMSIVEEVKTSTQLMLNQLIHQLRTNLQLPACLRVIGFLRRMDVFTEAELRIKFLQARDSWFQGILEAVPRDDPYAHITKTIELSRVHLFDIITQYRAIFSDEDPLLTTTRDETINEAALFHGWVVQKVSHFLSTLEIDLQHGVGGRLDSLLGQCMYFGLSFSRVGADFRGLLPSIFKTAALQNFKAGLKEANTRFEENMQSYNLLGVTSAGSGINYGSSTQPGTVYPPTVLLEFYPLAAYCNHVLTAFNDLRLCAPVNLACEIADCVQQSLLEVNRVILAFFRAEETTFNLQEGEQFGQFCATYITDLLPYLNKCLQVLFPASQLAQALGVSVTELHKLGSVGQVDLKAVLKQVSHLIPVVKESPTPISSSTAAPHNPSSPPNQPANKTETSVLRAQDTDATGTTTVPGSQDTDTTGTTTVAKSPDTDTSSTTDIPRSPDTDATGTIPVPKSPDTDATGTTDIPRSPNTDATGTTDIPKSPDTDATGTITVPKSPDTDTTGTPTVPKSPDTDATGPTPVPQSPDTDAVVHSDDGRVTHTDTTTVAATPDGPDRVPVVAGPDTSVDAVAPSSADGWSNSWGDNDFSIDLDSVQLTGGAPAGIDIGLASSLVDSVLQGGTTSVGETGDVKKQD